VNYVDNRIFVASLLVAFFRLISDISVYSSKYMAKFLFILLAFVIFRILLKLSYIYFTKKTKISLLEVGMIPAENIEFSGKKYKKSPLYYSLKRAVGGIFKKHTGLSEADLNAIKNADKKYKIKNILVYQTVSFAPFLFISVILIVFLGAHF